MRADFGAHNTAAARMDFGAVDSMQTLREGVQTLESAIFDYFNSILHIGYAALRRISIWIIKYKSVFIFVTMDECMRPTRTVISYQLISAWSHDAMPVMNCIPEKISTHPA
ncbi:hypothetical protein [Magnetofaba australis]|uniref:hypothetical protein n=1 Tax=Magnetofaba australis TaxID=1472297 RepID=UPI000A19BD84|nr:hypothetical protein [Magnetofaba australis]